jgi:ferredoxin--NADP+ reductase
VGWYNGHPDYRELPVDLSCERAVVVGNGNVAMDVAHMLVTDPEALQATDMAGHALGALGQSRIREVVVLGRRGAAQASFTTPELRELGRLEGVDVIVDPRNIELDPASRAAAAEDRTARANLKHLQEYAAGAGRTARAASPCASWPLRSRSSGGAAASPPCGSSRTSSWWTPSAGSGRRGRARSS